MSHFGFHLDVLDHGSPRASRLANLAASAVLFLIVALPIFAVGARLVA